MSGSGPVRAVLLDLDGTLYDQRRVRAAMAAELGVLAWWRRRPLETPRVWRALRTFRRVREELRELGHAAARLEDLQYMAAAEAAGCDEAFVRASVDEWMFRRPLRYLARARRPGVAEALAACRAAGLEVGVFSDYPTRAKLDALDLTSCITLELSATDADVNAFKPHPRGFLAACSRWGLDPAEVVYVGDRPDVDAAGAAAAGMRCIIVGTAAGSAASCLAMPSFNGFDRALAAAQTPTALAAHTS